MKAAHIRVCVSVLEVLLWSSDKGKKETKSKERSILSVLVCEEVESELYDLGVYEWESLACENIVILFF